MVTSPHSVMLAVHPGSTRTVLHGGGKGADCGVFATTMSAEEACMEAQEE